MRRMYSTRELKPYTHHVYLTGNEEFLLTFNSARKEPFTTLEELYNELNPITSYYIYMIQLGEPCIVRAIDSIDYTNNKIVTWDSEFAIRRLNDIVY